MSSKLFLGAGLVTIVLWTERPAEACGGFFCDGAQPVIQTGEGIIFAVDGASNTVDAVINIQYQGTAAEFAWVLPLQSAPTSIEVAPAFLFSTMDRLTAPSFSTQWTTRGECRTPEYQGGSVDAAAGGFDAGASPGGPGSGVEVLAQKAVGPYHSVVIRSSDPEEMRTWLVENGYLVTAEMMLSVVPYVTKGDVLLALKLRNDRAAGDIQPIWVQMTGSEVCVPIRLTAIAAAQDMDITTLVLSKQGRAIPENYNHLQLNWARLDWVRNGANYRSLVAEAADQGSGNAFVTEYAGPSRIFDDQLHRTGQYDRAAIEESTRVDDLIRRLQTQGLTVHPEVAAILTATIGVERLRAAGIPPEQFARCPGCWAGQLEGLEIDGRGVAASVWARVVLPLAALQDMFDRYQYATRLFTLISPEEMNVDPEFAFRSDLPQISNGHSAIITRDCTGGVEWSEAPLEVFVPETGQTLFLGPSGDERKGLDALPAASVVEQLAQGLVLEDRRAEIDAALAVQEEVMRPYVPGGQGPRSGADGCDCRTSPGTDSTLALGLLLFAWVLVRRRRAT